MNSRTGKSAVTCGSLVTANTATATATNLAFSDFPYVTLLCKRANIATISNFSIFNKVEKARLFLKKHVNLVKYHVYL